MGYFRMGYKSITIPPLLKMGYFRMGYKSISITPLLMRVGGIHTSAKIYTGVGGIFLVQFFGPKTLFGLEDPSFTHYPNYVT